MTGACRPRPHRLRRPFGCAPGADIVGTDDGVDLRVDGRNTVNTGLDQIDRCNFIVANAPAEFNGR